MKKLIVFLAILVLIIPNKINALNLDTESIIVKDINSGRVFYKKNEHDQRLIASTTKIMTAILAIESNKLENIVTVDEEILKMYGSNIYLELNEKITLLDLVYGLMLRSGNDASVVIAKYISGSIDNFVKEMNIKAKEIDMKNTVFNNPNGLDDDTKNYSTAEDLSILYSYAYKNNIFKEIVKTNHYQTSSNLKSYNWYNRNKILKLYDKATGGKTGYTPSAKRVLVTSASNNNLDLVAVSFNNIYDYDLHIKVYEEVFNNYNNYVLVDKNNFKYENNNKNLYIKESFSYPLSKQEYENISIKLDITSKNKKISIISNNEVIKEIKIYEKKKENKNIFEKIVDIIKNL